MNAIIANVLRAGLVLALACATSAAWGQATRTWVSGVGDDANPCSRTAPCKTFAGTISKTAACGEINVLDPGGFGAVTINKPLTIDGLGPMASILAAFTNGININIPAGDIAGCPAGAAHVVTLRNLSINGAGSGLIGINVTAVDELHVENLVIFGFRAGSALGISFHPSVPAGLYVQNTTFTDILNQGISIHPGAGGVVNASIKNTKMSQNGGGMIAWDNTYVTVTDSVASGNGGYGFQVSGTTGYGKVHLDRTVVTDNGVAGVRTDGALAVIRLSASTLVNNNTGISIGGGTVVSYGNNTIGGNLPGGDGSPSSTSVLH
jgi:hypothetical protein